MDLIEAAHGSGNRHPWELSRRDLVASLLAGRESWRGLADVGAGDGFVAKSFRPRVTGPVYAVDVNYPASLDTGNIHWVRSLADVPAGAAECILLMDVLEHVEDDGGLVRDIGTKLLPGGLVVVTVPAFAWLYSVHDEYLGHVRRYQRETLRDVLERNGLIVDEMFYFFMLLFAVRSLMVVMHRVWPQRQSRGVGDWRFPEHHLLTRLLWRALNWDRSICRQVNRLAIRVPGLSICAVCRKASV